MAKPWGGVFTFSKMTCYLNDRNIKLGTLLKEGLLHSPSFTKVLHPIFLFWYFEAVRFALQIFLHQSTTFYFLIFGTLKQSDLLCKSFCIKVLHSIFLILVL